MPQPAIVDHIVIRAPSLDTGAAYVADALGLAKQSLDLATGGAHAAMGTHNLILDVGGPYLEVIAIDPEAPAPPRARWFGLDNPSPEAAVIAWVARVPDARAHQQTRAHQEVGDPIAVTRGDLSWQITVRDDGHVPFKGVGPLLISWESAPPSAAPSEATLISLIAIHPSPEGLVALLDDIDLAGPVSVQAGPSPRLLAAFDTPQGPRILAGDGGGMDVLEERQAAMDLFHRTWRYLDRTDRTPEHDAAMIACAQASLWHWRRVGAPTQWAIGEWQCSRVHAVLGDGQQAVSYARRSLELAESNRVDDFVPASAHEALSRAYAVLGDFDAARDERNAAYRMALELDDEDRDVIEHDLGTIEIPLG